MNNSTSTGETRGRGRPQVPAVKLNVFLSALSDTFHVGRSAKLAGVDPSTLHNLRRRNPEFAQAWSAALDGLPARVSDAIYEEALEGTPILDAEGKEVGRRRNTRLLERLGEQHGLLPSSRTSVAVQVNNGAEASGALDAADHERIRQLLRGQGRRVLEGTATEVTPAEGGAPEPSPAVLIDGADLVEQPADGSDLI